MSRPHGGRRRLSSIGAASAFLLTAACVTDVTPPQQTLWEAEVEGAPEHGTVSGTAAAVSTDRVTRASIAVGGLSQGTYTWRIFEGECGSPGELLGIEIQYPDLVVTEEAGGSATDETDPALGGPMLAGRRYHVDVRQAGSGDAVACGDFRRRQ